MVLLSHLLHDLGDIVFHLMKKTTDLCRLILGMYLRLTYLRNRYLLLDENFNPALHFLYSRLNHLLQTLADHRLYPRGRDDRKTLILKSHLWLEYQTRHLTLDHLEWPFICPRQFLKALRSEGTNLLTNHRLQLELDQRDDFFG